jgi:aspartyl-tRNA(Asn)/glutamyl-tRNA(Gln) amidotransferase subunit C
MVIIFVQIAIYTFLRSVPDQYISALCSLWYNNFMTGISRDDVQRLAQLSSLRLGDDEAVVLQDDISNILTYIQQLAELDTTGIMPTYQVTDLKNIWRDDSVIDYGIGREELLALSHEPTSHQVKVPKVL